MHTAYVVIQAEALLLSYVFVYCQLNHFRAALILFTAYISRYPTVWAEYNFRACCVVWTGFPSSAGFSGDINGRYTLSYYHNQIGSMNYYPLFRVRSWNNGVRCIFFCILMEIYCMLNRLAHQDNFNVLRTYVYSSYHLTFTNKIESIDISWQKICKVHCVKLHMIDLCFALLWLYNQFLMIHVIHLPIFVRVS